MLGAGSAGIGIADQLVAAMMNAGLSEAAARSRVYMIDSHGLIHDGRSDLTPGKILYQQRQASLSDWSCANRAAISLLETVTNAKPTVLVGVTGQPGVFSQQVIKEMAAHCERPVIFPLSNPTSHCEAMPEDIIVWTEGRALVASGSPFAPVPFQGREIPIAQCNNSYIFPAMGLGVLASRANRVTDGMFMAAALALRDGSPAIHDPQASLLPPLEKIRMIARDIAIAVGQQAQNDGVAEKTTREQLEQRIDQTIWTPQYRTLKRRRK